MKIFFRNLEYQTMLEEISKEQKFEVTYVEVDEKTEDGESQCLVQVHPDMMISEFILWEVKPMKDFGK